MSSPEFRDWLRQIEKRLNKLDRREERNERRWRAIRMRQSRMLAIMEVLVEQLHAQAAARGVKLDLSKEIERRAQHYERQYRGGANNGPTTGG